VKVHNVKNLFQISLVMMWETKEGSCVIISTPWTMSHTVRNLCNLISDKMKFEFLEDLFVSHITR
jgi:hypothetical protein